MIFTLRLIFAGLVAFVPTAAGDVWVLLVDGRNPDKFQEGVLHHAHYPVVRVLKAELVGTGRQPDLWFSPSGSGQTEGIFFLDHEDLGVRGQFGSAPFGIESGKRKMGRSKPCRTMEDGSADVGCERHLYRYLVQKGDFSWVAPIPAVVTHADQVKPSCIAPMMPDEKDCPIVARFKVNIGTVRVRQLERSRDDEEGPDEILPEGVGVFSVPVGSMGSQDQAIAKQVEVVVKNVEGKVHLTSNVGDIVLQPDSNGELVISVENLPMEDIVRRTTGIPGTAQDFRALYELSNATVPLGSRRFPFSPLLANERICPVATFNP